MSVHQQTIQERLNRCSLLIRKYNLGDKEYFFSTFTGIASSQLEIAWDLALTEIQNKEIIKDAAVPLSAKNIIIVRSEIYRLNFSESSIYEFLNSKFDPKSLKLEDENRERNLRNFLAKELISKNLSEIKRLLVKKPSGLKRFIRLIRGLILVLIPVILLILLFASPRIIEGLTLPENLLNKYLHNAYPEIKDKAIDKNILAIYLIEESRYEFNGAICRDGTTSSSQGSGTCSWHGGVRRYFYKGNYSKNFKECEQKADIIINELRRKATATSWRN